MFRQVFSKMFQKKENKLSANEQYNGQAQIYAIPTVASSFQSRKMQTNRNDDRAMSSASSSTSFSNSSGSTSSTKPYYYARYDDNNTRHIYIAPHCIRYSNSTLDDTIYRIDDQYLNDIAVEILESDNMPPKLQIVQYDNNYFAINNSNLQVYKQLQLTGIITHVQADLINLEAIPFALREFLLQTPSHLNDYTDNEEFCQNLTSTESNETSNHSSSGANESLNDSDCHVECSYDSAPDVVFPEDVFEENNIYVDEIYEFGACENCVESGDEESNSPEKYEEMASGINKIKFEANSKLDVFLRDKKSAYSDNQSDLEKVVKNALKNEEIQGEIFKDLDSPSVSKTGDLADKLESLNLDLKQKKNSGVNVRGFVSWRTHQRRW